MTRFRLACSTPKSRQVAISAAFLGCVALMPVASQADDFVRPAYTQVNGGPIIRMQAKPDCTCRAQGSDFTVGSEVCLNSATFRCVMDQNVTSWQRMRDACPNS